MTARKIRKLVIVGAGNMATNLALGLYQKGYTILQVYNRSTDNGRRLARKVKATYIDDLSAISLKADLYILSVADRSLKKVAGQLHLNNRLVVHTSGTLSQDVLQDTSTNYGILYSPQTYSKNHPQKLSGTPFCIEANNNENLERLRMLAESLTPVVHVVSYRQRKIIHLAAVFANNFTNYMYAVAEDLLKNEELDFKILEPIIKRTAANVHYRNMFLLQTGPAIRGDNQVMKEHLALLKAHPGYQHVYELISQMIIQSKKTKDEL
jgi:predicted short-subunit dehydrogenase-like oxidoreductase (DUF2520 family)